MMLMIICPCTSPLICSTVTISRASKPMYEDLICKSFDHYCYHLCQRNPSTRSNISRTEQKEERCCNSRRQQSQGQQDGDQFEVLYSDEFDFKLDDDVLGLFDSQEFDMTEPQTNQMMDAGKCNFYSLLYFAYTI